jgi:hypothetical protein
LDVFWGETNQEGSWTFVSDAIESEILSEDPSNAEDGASV